MWSRCTWSRSAWCSPNRPASARRSSGILGRMRVRAMSAKASGSRCPAMSASSISRADLPSTSETTESSLMPASSSSFWMRWVSLALSSTSFLRDLTRYRKKLVEDRAKEQSALEELSQPGGVGHVGLASWDGLHVLGVHQQQLEGWLVFEHMPDGAPVDAGSLHGHLGDPFPDKPVPQPPQVIGEGVTQVAMEATGVYWRPVWH